MHAEGDWPDSEIVEAVVYSMVDLCPVINFDIPPDVRWSRHCIDERSDVTQGWRVFRYAETWI